MKISRLEFVTLLLAVVFMAFAADRPFRGQTASRPVRVEIERTLTQEIPLTLPVPTPSPSIRSKEDTPTDRMKINLNTAGVDGPMTLSGIEEKRAEDIIIHHRANGLSHTPEELTEVSGIGEGILGDLVDYVTTGGENR